MQGNEDSKGRIEMMTLEKPRSEKIRESEVIVDGQNQRAVSDWAKVVAISA